MTLLKRLGWLLWPLAGCPSDPLPIEPNNTAAVAPPTLPPLPPADDLGDNTVPLTLFQPGRLLPSDAAQALTFSPLTQLRYVGHISTPGQTWALILTPHGTHLAPLQAYLGLEGWQIEQITPQALTLAHPDAEPQQLALTTTGMPSP
ncbi:MAG: hypothetical protein KA214_04195 [Neisseriaceae bacterium]|nr:hypothetical protein [Neisseriaceae bacterium]